MTKYDYHLGDYIQSQSGVIYKIVELNRREKKIKGKIIRANNNWYPVSRIVDIDYHHSWTYPKKFNTPLYKALND